MKHIRAAIFNVQQTSRQYPEHDKVLLEILGKLVIIDKEIEITNYHLNKGK